MTKNLKVKFTVQIEVKVDERIQEWEIGRYIGVLERELVKTTENWTNTFGHAEEMLSIDVKREGFDGQRQQ